MKNILCTIIKNLNDLEMTFGNKFHDKNIKQCRKYNFAICTRNMPKTHTPSHQSSWCVKYHHEKTTNQLLTSSHLGLRNEQLRLSTVTLVEFWHTFWAFLVNKIRQHCVSFALQNYLRDYLFITKHIWNLPCDETMDEKNQSTTKCDCM